LDSNKGRMLKNSLFSEKRLALELAIV